MRIEKEKKYGGNLKIFKDREIESKTIYKRKVNLYKTTAKVMKNKVEK